MTTTSISISLCTGYGGLDMAIEAVLGTVLAAVAEVDPAAAKLLEYRYPDVPNLGDITTIDWTEWAGRVFAISAGYPCQPFSHAGRRKGTTDARHLWPHVLRAIRGVRPRVVVLENVAGHRSLGFDTVLGDLAAIGYDARWTSLRASDIGAPHRRERLFIVAQDADGAASCERWESAPGEAETGRPWADARGRDRALAADPRYGVEPERSRQAGREAGQRTPVGSEPRDLARHADDEPEAPQRIVPEGADAEPRRAGGVAWGVYAAAIRRWELVIGRTAPAPTERNTRGGQRLSPRFVEWMMGLPTGHVTDVPGISRNDQLKILGNGVVPQQATAALLALATDDWAVAA